MRDKTRCPDRDSFKALPITWEPCANWAVKFIYGTTNGVVFSPITPPQRWLVASSFSESFLKMGLRSRNCPRQVLPTRAVPWVSTAGSAASLLGRPAAICRLAFQTKVGGGSTVCDIYDPPPPSTRQLLHLLSLHCLHIQVCPEGAAPRDRSLFAPWGSLNGWGLMDLFI